MPPDYSAHEDMGVVLTDACGNPLNQAIKTYPCNEPAELLFYRCSTQWKSNPMTGALLGLDYDGVESAARMAGIEITPDLFYDLQTIERGALDITVEFPELDEVEILHVGFDDHDDEQDDSHWHPDNG